MIHDQVLVDRLSKLETERFEDEVFRATRINADSLAPSISGGRWAPPPDGALGVYALYTSLERDGAIAEFASLLVNLFPIPRPRLIKVTRLAVSTARTLRLACATLQTLGVDLARYGERDYAQTQRIGAALAFLELDGLIAPSARWPCDNLVIFSKSHALTERLNPIDEEHVEWTTWAQAHELIPGQPE